MTEQNHKASSATDGFFQALPVIPAQYTSCPTSSRVGQPPIDDPILRRILTLYLPTPTPASVDKSLRDLARTCLSPATLELSVDAELNAPTLSPLTTFGQPNETNALRTSEGWRGLKTIGIRAGSVALGYGLADNSTDVCWNRRVHQFAANHLWSATAALVTCPAAMSDGAAVLLSRRIGDPDGDQVGRAAVLTEARRRLISFDPDYAWSSGQWMTERSGGSDVAETETAAVRLNSSQGKQNDELLGGSKDSVGEPLGPWKIDGFKWFSSATDADMVVLLARTSSGISAFYAPMRRLCGGVAVMNGVRITRLKQKMGTKALPTSEVEIKGMRAWLIGEEGKGIKEISAVLNTTRLWTAGGAVGGLSRGLAISRAYSRVRKVRGIPLSKNMQHVRWLADETVKYRASAHFAFLGAAMNGIVEQGPGISAHTAAQCFLPTSRESAEILLRALTPVMKACCSLAAVDGLRSCMESLGGVGYCENNEDGGSMNIARLFRDANVNPIWEGTVSVMAEDLVRVLKGRQQNAALQTLDDLIHRMLEHCTPEFKCECSIVRNAWSRLRRDIQSLRTEDLLYAGRYLLTSIESVCCACILMCDATSDGDEIATAVAKRWIRMRFSSSYGTAIPSLQMDRELDARIYLNVNGDHDVCRPNL